MHHRKFGRFLAVVGFLFLCACGSDEGFWATSAVTPEVDSSVTQNGAPAGSGPDVKALITPPSQGSGSANSISVGTVRIVFTPANSSSPDLGSNNIVFSNVLPDQVVSGPTQITFNVADSGLKLNPVLQGLSSQPVGTRYTYWAVANYDNARYLSGGSAKLPITVFKVNFTL